jgi:hypothetical protein
MTNLCERCHCVPHTIKCSNAPGYCLECKKHPFVTGADFHDSKCTLAHGCCSECRRHPDSCTIKNERTYTPNGDNQECPECESHPDRNFHDIKCSKVPESCKSCNDKDKKCTAVPGYCTECQRHPTPRVKNVNFHDAACGEYESFGHCVECKEYVGGVYDTGNLHAINCTLTPTNCDICISEGTKCSLVPGYCATCLRHPWLLCKDGAFHAQGCGKYRPNHDDIFSMKKLPSSKKHK